MLSPNIQNPMGQAQYSNGVDLGAGVGSIQALTIPSYSNPARQSASTAASPAAYTGPLANSSFLGEPFAVWLGFIVLLVALKFFSERPKSDLNPAFIRIGGYNIMAIGLSAGVFFILMKVIFNKIQVPGVTQFANAL